MLFRSNWPAAAHLLLDHRLETFEPLLSRIDPQAVARLVDGQAP